MRYAVVGVLSAVALAVLALFVAESRDARRDRKRHADWQARVLAERNARAAAHAERTRRVVLIADSTLYMPAVWLDMEADYQTRSTTP